MTTTHSEPTLRELVHARRLILMARAELASCRNQARRLLDFGGDEGLLMATLEREIAELAERGLEGPAKPDTTLPTFEHGDLVIVTSAGLAARVTRRQAPEVYEVEYLGSGSRSLVHAGCLEPRPELSE